MAKRVKRRTTNLSRASNAFAEAGSQATSRAASGSEGPSPFASSRHTSAAGMAPMAIPRPEKTKRYDRPSDSTSPASSEESESAGNIILTQLDRSPIREVFQKVHKTSAHYCIWRCAVGHAVCASAPHGGGRGRIATGFEEEEVYLVLALANMKATVLCFEFEKDGDRLG